MSRDRYLANQRSQPDYELARAVAHAQLGLADALYRQRDALGLSEEEAAAKAGLEIQRLKMIEEGDTSSFTEILRLISALGLVMRIDRELRVVVSSENEMSVDAHGNARMPVVAGSPGGR